MRVVLTDVNEEGLRALSRELEGSLSFRADVTQASDVDALADFVREEVGTVHVLINNAGIAGGGVIWECPPEQWERVLGVNLWGAIHMCRAFVPMMIENDSESCVVNVASIAGLASPGLTGPYNVSKHAVVAYSETLHHDLRMRKTNVSVCCVCPAWVRTGILDAPNVAAPAKPQAEYETLEKALRAVIAAGMDPAQLAELVFTAIDEKRFYVLAPASTRELVRRHFEAIVSGADPHVPAMGVKKAK